MGGDKKGRKMPDGDANAFYPAYRIGIRRPDKVLTPPSGTRFYIMPLSR